MKVKTLSRVTAIKRGVESVLRENAEADLGSVSRKKERKSVKTFQRKEASICYLKEWK